MPAPALLTDCRTLSDALAHLADGLGDGALDWSPHVEVQAADVPEPQKDLLVHELHMTVVLERFWKKPVVLEVLRSATSDTTYRREILLRAGTGGPVIEYGLVRMRRDAFSTGAWGEIQTESAPLGEIMIRHDVLRRIEPLRYVRFDLLPNRRPAAGFDASVRRAFGRVGIIHCNGLEAIELLEVVAMPNMSD